MIQPDGYPSTEATQWVLKKSGISVPPSLDKSMFAIYY